MQYKIYDPLETQLRFHNTDAIYRLFWGAAWGWKSKALRMEGTRQCISSPWIHWIILRRTYWELRGAIISRLLEELPKDMEHTYNQSKNVLTFHNIKDSYWNVGESSIKFWQCQYEKDVYKYQWEEFDFIWIDELTHFTEFMFKYLLSRLRSTKKNIVPNFFASTNPGWIWHTRVKRLWIDRQYNKWEKGWEYKFIPSFLSDNKYLVDNDPDYILRLEALPEMERRALLHWDRDIFEWQFFKEYRKEIHTCDPFLPKHWKTIIALDYWYTNPSAVYRINKSNSWKLTIYRELYVTENTYKMLASKIKALTWEDEDIRAVVVDPAIFAKSWNVENWMSGWDIMQKILPRKIERWNNSRVEGWRTYRTALKPYKDPNFWNITAQLQICSNCENLIRTLPWMIHDKLNVEDLDSSWEDHSCFVWDTLILMSDWTQKRIKDIKIWDYVKTENWINKVVKQWLTKKNAKIFEIEFLNWAILHWTWNHPIYTIKWKKRLDCISYFDIIKSIYINNKIKWKTQQQNLTERSITLIENIMLRTIKKLINQDCIKQYGYLIIEKFQKVIKFITKIKTQWIMKYQILSWFLQRSIWVCTEKKILKAIKNIILNILKRLDLLQKFDIEAKNEKNDIVNIQKNNGKKENYIQKYAKFVEKNTKHIYSNGVNTATTIVKLPHFVGEENVYNITVENEHNYYANWILVSNCDSTRYWLMFLWVEKMWFGDVMENKELIKKETENNFLKRNLEIDRKKDILQEEF